MLEIQKQSITICGVRVDLTSKQEILLEITHIIQEEKKAVFAYLNAHGINLAIKNEWLKGFYQDAHVVYADGQGIRFASMLLRKVIPQHLPLTVWIWDILKLCEDKNYSVFILGGKENVTNLAVTNIRCRYPKLNISGYHHGYCQKDGIESENIVSMINDASTDLLFVGFGMPMQESWIQQNYDNLNVHVIFPVGGCIDVLAEKRWKIPKFVRQIGLEWLFRLLEDPKRLFVRYVIGNPKFILNILKEYFRMQK